MWSKELETCDFCGDKELVIIDDDNPYHLMCEDCIEWYELTCGDMFHE